MRLQQELYQWAQQKITASLKDALIDVSSTKNKVEVAPNELLEFKGVAKKIQQEALEFQRNSGIDTLCFIDKVVCWNYKETEVVTPLHLLHAKASKKDLGQRITFTVPEDDGFVNPFLIQLFQLPQTAEVEDVIHAFESENIQFTIVESSSFANVHPYRFSILRELQLLSEAEILPSALTQLLSTEKNPLENFILEKGKLSATDPDQKRVFKALENEDLVVQGPPGTGKSQTITNILAKSLYQGKTALISSEKGAALRVIYDKFKHHNLHHFLCFYEGKNDRKEFIGRLENTWNFLEQHSTTHQSFLAISNLEVQQLNNKLERLKNPTALGGVDLLTFKQRVKDIDLSSVKIDGKLPELKDWLLQKETLGYFLEDDFFKAYKSWSFLPQDIWETQNLEGFFNRIENFKTSLKNEYPENISAQEIAQKAKQSNYIHLFFYDNLALDETLLEHDSSKQKAFYRNLNQLEKLHHEKELLLKERENWNKEMSLSEIDGYIDFFKSERGLKFSHFRVKNKLKKLSRLHYEAIPGGLENLKRIEEVEQKILELELKFGKLNLPKDILALKSIKNTLDRSKSADQNVLKEISQLNTEEKTQVYNTAATHIANDKFIHTYLSGINKQLPVLEQVTEVEQEIRFCAKVKDKVESLHPSLRYAYQNYDDLQVIEEKILKNAWVQFQTLNPDLAEFNGETLQRTLDRILSLEEQEQQLFAEVIQDRQKEKFEDLQRLLSTPARQLSEKEKERKKELREGKKILIHEFGKSRQHKSLLELLNSPAKHWIFALQPLFVLNTTQVADTLPLEQNLLDIVILDEASQIPFTHALGSIYRGKRCMITGDGQQMAPSHYFEQDTEEGDILHKASFSFKNLGLKHHYRSQHSALIAFSNQNFYNNELKVYPSPKTSAPILQHHFVEGLMTDKGNKEEAKAVVTFVEALVAKQEKGLGIVCFNEKQYKLLLKNFSNESLAYLTDEANGCFIKTLEKVQGDECLHLIISTTYAPTAEGEFAMRFGPINKDGGEKRLNVLMSRAKNRITSFSSFTAKDLKMSTNTGVETFRKLMYFLENKNANPPMEFNQGITHSSENELAIKISDLPNVNAQELCTQHLVLQDRGWKLKYLL